MNFRLIYNTNKIGCDYMCMIENRKKNYLFSFLLSFFFTSLFNAQNTAPTCIGNWGPPIVNQTFGQGNATNQWYGPLSTYAPGASTSTIFVGAAGPGGNLNDGYSGLVKNPAVQQGNFRWRDSADHTGNTNGLMLLINAPSTAATVFFEYVMNNLCPNTTLKLSIWVLNVNGSWTCPNSYQFPNLTLRAVDPATGNVLGTSVTGNIPIDPNWKEYSIIFNNTSSSSVKLQVINNSVGNGCGNDIAIDDITVSPCIPSSILAAPSASTSLCPDQNSTVTFMANLTGSSYSPAEYQWQYSSDSGTTWIDQGTPSTNPNYTFDSNGKAPGTYLVRFKVGPQGSSLNSQCNAISRNETVVIRTPPKVNDTTLESCFIEGNPASALFNLNNANVTSETGVTKKYYPSPTDAMNSTNEIMNPLSYNAPNGVVYVKVFNVYGCYSISKVTLTVLAPVYSNILKDKIICIEDKTTLDAGPGFDGYEWSTGETTQSIRNVGVGTYWVKLKTGDCIAIQHVKVYASEQPVIKNIDISNNTVTIHAEGGTKPYKYSMDNITWQDSNVFLNVARGEGRVYVQDLYACEPNEVKITVLNLMNVITPNGDGINDVIDYSALGIKNNLAMNIYDRYGNSVYNLDKSRGYRWDGTFGGKKVPTGTYWYSLSWNNKNNTSFKFSGWILVKNRE
ncbi:T9SS type B sorting domain-containing protein [Chryseobacterium sp.]|uniref:T9SS type B sorting domain-containing protein n=2 Tax=Chryseobacterium sp. TaxID=1871047 RepID=UPI00289BE825|nr:T9SS type B sorting domain-containing protein [Chryseobacterium sp.]